jgi:hypothetical protein
MHGQHMTEHGLNHLSIMLIYLKDDPVISEFRIIFVRYTALSVISLLIFIRLFDFFSKESDYVLKFCRKYDSIQC